MNREKWLTKLTDKMRPLFQENGATIPEKIRLTCGWPSKKAFSQKSRTIGECWLRGSADGTIEVFISPCVSDSAHVGAILAHELVHAAGNTGHRGNFRKVATAIGLEGKMTATRAGPKLLDRLNALTKDLGEYPHAVLDKSMSPHKKNGTRMIKLTCAGCGYIVRTTQKWIDTGLPVCPCGNEMEVK